VASKKIVIKICRMETQKPRQTEQALCIVASLKNYPFFFYLIFNVTLSAFNNFIGLSTIPFGT
jgi:hypothetical protein